jgi:hypothetical protein
MKGFYNQIKNKNSNEDEDEDEDESGSLKMDDGILKKKRWRNEAK